MKNIIWSNTFDINDYEDYLDEEYPDATEETRYEIANETNNSYYEDELVNLDKELDTGLLVIADLGLWDGRHSGIKEIGNNLKNCLISDCDYLTWYYDEHDFKCDASHHDGTNHYLYRRWLPGLSQKRKNNFKTKVMSGKYTYKDIKRYTMSLVDDLKSVYGN